MAQEKEYYGEDDDLETNNAPRLPVCLCIDVSGSMLEVTNPSDTTYTGETVERDGNTYDVVTSGRTRLDEVIDAVNTFYDTIKKDPKARQSCEISIVLFSETANLVEDYSLVDRKEVFSHQKTDDYEHDGTNMSKGVTLALETLTQRKALYKSTGVDYYQPWLVLLTDGNPTDDVKDIQRLTQQMEAGKKLSVLPFILGDDVNREVLAGFSHRPPIRVNDMEKCFEWLGKSVSQVSNSRVGETVKVDTTDITKWGEY
jgi:uncharacterized protein YegL